MDQSDTAKNRLLGAESWVFDLDNTLYPRSSKLFTQVDRRMTRFVADFLGLALDDAYRVQKTYFREHGTTLRGLMDRHGLDPAEYLHFVHDIDLAPIAPDATLDQALERLPGRKIVFTNAPDDYAHRILDRLALDRHFEAVFDIHAADYVPKPEPAIYDVLVRRHGLDPTKTVMVEDIARNLAPAGAMGMVTVWARWDTDEDHGLADEDHAVDHVVDDLSGWLAELTADAGT